MAPVCALIGICMAGYLGSWVLRQDPGPDKMNNISIKIQQGAKAFLMSEYKLLVIFMVIVAVVMAVALSPITALAFVTGGVMSAAAGYVGMHVATRANTRTAYAAEESVAKALNISFKSGLTMGLCVASFALLGLSLWLIAMVFGLAMGVDINAELANLMHTNIGMVEGFATGASAVALFARVGGGIYTKAADVGADLVGKVEAGIPEDDPRNPATIADNVGDNVGDVAGMGADLFESYTGAILAPTILAATFGALGGYFATGDLVWALVTPVIIAGCGIITSIIGLFAVRAKEGAALHKALNRGTYLAAGIEIIVIFCLFYIWSTQSVEAQPLWLFGSVLCGLVAGLAIGKITEYFCSDKYKPVHKIADAADTGAATVIIEGIGTGMLSTIAPIVLVALAIIGAFTFGNMAFPLASAEGGIAVGLFGVGLAATGMLSNTAITIGVDGLRSRGRQRGWHRRNGGPARGSARSHRRSGRRGQHDGRHRKGLRHRIRGPVGYLAVRVLPGHDASRHPSVRTDAHRPAHCGRYLHRRDDAVHVRRPHHGRGVACGPRDGGGSAPPIP